LSLNLSSLLFLVMPFLAMPFTGGWGLQSGPAGVMPVVVAQKKAGRRQPTGLERA
jgi:hypothetical protein